MRTKASVRTKDGINWYYEQEGSGPHIILIPDGTGDCQEFDKSISTIASKGFTVTTFDNPGMSRSGDSPPETYQKVTAPMLAAQVIDLMDELHIDVATFWGSSSAGAVVLALASLYPARTRNGLPHEIPTGERKMFAVLAEKDDEFVSKTISSSFGKMFPTDLEVWEAMGEEFHARVWKNYARWVKGYGVTLTPSITMSDEDLAKRPLDWSVGGASATHMFIDNVITATKAGITVRVLPGAHFPYIFDPDAFSDYIVERTRAYL